MAGETEGATLDSEKEGFDRKTIQGSPAIAGSKVYVGSRDAHLYAFDLKTGKRLWRAGKPAPWVVTSPVVWGGRIYFGSSDGYYVAAVEADMSGNLFALDAATGAVYAIRAADGSSLRRAVF